MFAKVGKRTNIYNTLNYNEIKVTQGKAEFLFSENFIKPGHLLSREDKLDRFMQRNSLYQGITPPMIQVSLNFSAEEKIINEKMMEIVRRYMPVLELDRQPYLAYRHHDTGHPHCHIVTTVVSRTGELLYLNPGML